MARLVPPPIGAPARAGHRPARARVDGRRAARRWSATCGASTGPTSAAPSCAATSPPPSTRTAATSTSCSASPTLTPEWIDAHFHCTGIEHIADGVAAGQRRGARAAAPRQLGLRRRVARAPGLHRHRRRRAGGAARAVRLVRRDARPPRDAGDPAVAVGRHRGAQGGARQRGRVPARRPRPHRRRHRGRVLRRAHHAARRSGHDRAARRRAAAPGRVLLPAHGDTGPTSCPPLADGAHRAPPRRPRPGHPGPRPRLRGPHPGRAHALAPAAAQLAQRHRRGATIGMDDRDDREDVR